MGPLGSKISALGVELSDSPYVAASMQSHDPHGQAAATWTPWARTGSSFRPCTRLESRSTRREADVPWPCNETKYIVHYPRDTGDHGRSGSGYGGNALLGKKCYALRIASVMARDEGWLARSICLHPQAHLAHRRGPLSGRRLPEFLRQDQPRDAAADSAGLEEAETIGDDICCQMRFGEDGRLWAINPEAGFFGVAPGTGHATNPNAIAALSRNTIFTNVARTSDGDVWWEGLTDAPPEGLTDWKGRPWTPGGDPAAHPNSRFTAPAEQCPSIAPEWQDPTGVPLSAILFGGRRASAVPLVTEAFDWNHGVFLASNVASEGTAAAENRVGELRRDPFAMLPFCGYNMGDYFAHWLKVGAGADPAKLPRLFFVNWFRKDARGKFVWPGFGDNSRVLKWIVQRLEGEVGARETPIGRLPEPGDLDVRGLSLSPEQLSLLLTVDPEVWREEASLIPPAYEQFGERLPAELWAQYEALVARLAQAQVPEVAVA